SRTFLEKLANLDAKTMREDRFGATPKPTRETRVLPINENSPLPAANPARYSNLPARHLRLDHYDGRRAIRSGAFRRRTRQQPTCETAAQLFHPFLLTRRLPGHESFSRFEYCRDLAASVVRRDLLITTSSTIQTAKGPSGAAAVDYAKSIRQPDGAPPHEALPSCRCLPRRERLADCPRYVLVHRMPQAPPVRLLKAALAPCYLQIRDNSFPRFQPRDRSTFLP